DYWPSVTTEYPKPRVLWVPSPWEDRSQAAWYGRPRTCGLRAGHELQQPIQGDGVVVVVEDSNEQPVSHGEADRISRILIGALSIGHCGTGKAGGSTVFQDGERDRRGIRADASEEVRHGTACRHRGCITAHGRQIVQRKQYGGAHVHSHLPAAAADNRRAGPR